MATALMIAVGALAAVVFVLAAVVFELLRDVAQLRDAAGILDRPLTVDVGTVAGTTPSEQGMPRALDSEATALVLFLSSRCATCRSLAASFDEHLPPGLWVILEADDPADSADLIETFGLKRMVNEDRLIVDGAGGIARRIGLDITPVGFRIESGKIAGATTVPSSRYLASVLPKPVRLRPGGNFTGERRALA